MRPYEWYYHTTDGKTNIISVVGDAIYFNGHIATKTDLAIIREVMEHGLLISNEALSVEQIAHWYNLTIRQATEGGEKGGGKNEQT